MTSLEKAGLNDMNIICKSPKGMKKVVPRGRCKQLVNIFHVTLIDIIQKLMNSRHHLSPSLLFFNVIPILNVKASVTILAEFCPEFQAP